MLTSKRRIDPVSLTIEWRTITLEVPPNRHPYYRIHLERVTTREITPIWIEAQKDTQTKTGKGVKRKRDKNIQSLQNIYRSTTCNRITDSDRLKGKKKGCKIELLHTRRT